MTDANITFGTALRSPYDVADSARRIEELGYDVLGCGEHVSFYGDTANGFVSLSVAAGVTSRVRLLSAITLVPLYPAALLAKLGAALDVASNKRNLPVSSSISAGRASPATTAATAARAGSTRPRRSNTSARCLRARDFSRSGSPSSASTFSK